MFLLMAFSMPHQSVACAQNYFYWICTCSRHTRITVCVQFRSNMQMWRCKHPLHLGLVCEFSSREYFCSKTNSVAHPQPTQNPDDTHTYGYAVCQKLDRIIFEEFHTFFAHSLLSLRSRIPLTAFVVCLCAECDAVLRLSCLSNGTNRRRHFQFTIFMFTQIPNWKRISRDSITEHFAIKSFQCIDNDMH